MMSRTRHLTSRHVYHKSQLREADEEMEFMRAIPCKLWLIGPSASISDVDYNGLVSISPLMSVNSSISHARVTRGSCTLYFTSHMEPTSLSFSSLKMYRYL